jgi:hypothetical protein
MLSNIKNEITRPPFKIFLNPNGILDDLLVD